MNKREKWILSILCSFAAVFAIGLFCVLFEFSKAPNLSEIYLEQSASADRKTSATLKYYAYAYRSDVLSSSYYNPVTTQVKIEYVRSGSDSNWTIMNQTVAAGIVYPSNPYFFAISKEYDKGSGTNLGNKERIVRLDFTPKSGITINKAIVEYYRSTSFVSTLFNAKPSIGGVVLSFTAGTADEKTTEIRVTLETSATYTLSGNGTSMSVTQTLTGNKTLSGYDLSRFDRPGYTYDFRYSGNRILYKSGSSWLFNYLPEPGTLTANYTANNYTVNFNANGGSGSMNSQAFTYGTSQALTSNGFTAPTGKSFAGWATSAGGEVVYSNGQSVSNLTTTQNGSVTLYAKWVSDPVKLSLQTNGGNYSGATTIIKEYGQTVTLPVPTREGYTFKGWMPKNGNGSLSTFGKTHQNTTDGCFDSSLNSVWGAYGGSNGQVSTVSKPSDLDLPDSKNVMNIRSVNTNSTWVSVSGFTNYFSSGAGKVFYSVIYAKVPLGYKLEAIGNAHGDNTNDRWITSNVGTGTWKTFIYKWVCGTSGTFDTISFFYLSSGPASTDENPINWQVAYFGTFDGTGLTASEKIDQPTTYTYGTQDATLVALWEKNVEITINDGLATKSTSLGTDTLYGLEVPDREGYIFNGWTVSGGGEVVESQYLTTEKTFNGTSDYVDLGTTYKYTDKFFFSVDAYMDNWGEYATKDMRIVSCTEGGGWDIQSSNSNIQAAFYDRYQNMYVRITPQLNWSDLSSGWHNFAVSYNGSTATLYIDGVDRGSTPAMKNGIGYHSSNSILLGAEPGSGSTAVGNYFKGKMKNVVFRSDNVSGVSNLSGCSYFYLSDGRNATVTANWIETWAASASKEPFVNQDGFNLISTPEQLAKLAVEVNSGSSKQGEKFKLSNDIDLAGKYWLPIGNHTARFQGTFDGNGYTISNVKSDFFSDIGLFGKIMNATVSNLKLSQIEIKGGAYAGGLVGVATSSEIKNCKITSGSVVSRTWVAGGICGCAENNTVIENCDNNALVEACYHGGICGFANTSKIVGCINRGTIQNYDEGGDYYYGGIVGKLQGVGTRVETCINYGDIVNKKNVDGTGGIAGANDGSNTLIYACANYGDIIFKNGSTRFSGGLVGRNNREDLLIEYCSSICNISGRGREASGTSVLFGLEGRYDIFASYASVTVGGEVKKQAFGEASSFNYAFRYMEGLNYNLPMQIDLFHIAAEIPQQNDVFEKGLSGFTRI